MNLTARFRWSRVFACCLLVAGAARLRAQTPSTADALREVETAIRAESTQKKPDADPTGERASMGPMMLVQLHNSFDYEEPSRRENALDQIASYFPSEAVRAAVEKLRAALHAEREAREKASVAEVQTALDNARAALQTANAPADLDRTLLELGRANVRRQAGSETDAVVRAGSARVQAALRFVDSWQTYLANRAAGDWSQAVQNLQNITNNDGTTDLLPRSQVLARLDEARKTVADFPARRCREIMAGTRTLDDLPAAIAALAEVQAHDSQHSGYNDLGPSLQSQLVALRASYLDFQAGIGAEVSIRPPTSMNANAEALELVRPLVGQMLRLACPRYLQIKDLPGPEEPIGEYLDRINAGATRTLDARLLERVGLLRAQINGTANNYYPGERAALQLLIAARNQEDAGQYEPAVVSYEGALKTGGSAIPASAVGDRLENIKSSHPQEYQLGLQRFLATPEPEAPIYRTPSTGGNNIRAPGLPPGSTPSPKP